MANNSDSRKKMPASPPHCYSFNIIFTDCYTIALQAGTNYCYDTQGRGTLIIDGEPVTITGYVNNNLQFSGVGIAATISDLVGLEYVFVLRSETTQLVKLYPLSLFTNVPAFIATNNNLEDFNLMIKNHYHIDSYISDFYLLGQKHSVKIDLETGPQSSVAVIVDDQNESSCCGDELSLNYKETNVVHIFSSANASNEKVEVNIRCYGSLFKSNIQGYIIPTNNRLYVESDFNESLSDSSQDNSIIYIIIACVVVVIIIVVVVVAYYCFYKKPKNVDERGEPKYSNEQRVNKVEPMEPTFPPPTNYYQAEQPFLQQQQSPPPLYGQPEYMVTQPEYMPQKGYDAPSRIYQT